MPTLKATANGPCPRRHRRRRLFYRLSRSLCLLFAPFAAAAYLWTTRSPLVQARCWLGSRWCQLGHCRCRLGASSVSARSPLVPARSKPVPARCPATAGSVTAGHGAVSVTAGSGPVLARFPPVPPCKLGHCRCLLGTGSVPASPGSAGSVPAWFPLGGGTVPVYSFFTQIYHH